MAGYGQNGPSGAFSAGGHATPKPRHLGQLIVAGGRGGLNRRGTAPELESRLPSHDLHCLISSPYDSLCNVLRRGCFTSLSPLNGARGRKPGGGGVLPISLHPAYTLSKSRLGSNSIRPMRSRRLGKA